MTSVLLHTRRLALARLREEAVPENMFTDNRTLVEARNSQRHCLDPRCIMHGGIIEASPEQDSVKMASPECSDESLTQAKGCERASPEHIVKVDVQLHGGTREHCRKAARDMRRDTRSLGSSSWTMRAYSIAGRLHFHVCASNT